MNRMDGRVHKQVAELLSAYIDGQVSAGERALVERHLAACPACTRELAALRLTVRMLRQLPVVSAPRAFTLSQSKVAPARPGVWRWVFGAPGLATGLAAFLCVVAVGGRRPAGPAGTARGGDTGRHGPRARRVGDPPGAGRSRPASHHC